MKGRPFNNRKTVSSKIIQRVRGVKATTDKDKVIMALTMPELLIKLRKKRIAQKRVTFSKFEHIIVHNKGEMHKQYRRNH